MSLSRTIGSRKCYLSQFLFQNALLLFYKQQLKREQKSDKGSEKMLKYKQFSTFLILIA